MATKLDRMVSYFDGLPRLNLYDLLLRDLARSRDKIKLIYLHYYYISTPVPIATKLGTMMTYLEGLLIIKSFSALTT